MISRLRVCLLFVVWTVTTLAAAQSSDPQQLLAEADRLAWNKAWTRAAPLYVEAARLFTARGNMRDALYARVNAIRGDLQRRSIQEVSEQFGAYLEHPLARTDLKLRLRILVLRGETDEDFDPPGAERAWREAADIAATLGDDAWANRAKGELGVVAFLQGRVSESVILLGQALRTAEATGDVPSQIRWLTLFGHGHAQLGRHDQSLLLYDRALALAATVPAMGMPLLTWVGKADALRLAGRIDEAARVLDDAHIVALKSDAWGYQAEIAAQQATIALAREQPARAQALLIQARTLARRAGGDRLLLGIGLELARLQRTRGMTAAAALTLREALAAARRMRDRLWLPRLLTERAELAFAQQRPADARASLVEASELLDGVIANVSSPWVRSQLIGVMDDVYRARIRLEGRDRRDPARLWAVIEQARARSLLELLLSRPVHEIVPSPAYRAGERAITALQVQLYRATAPSQRQRLLTKIFATEEQLAPLATALYDRTRHHPRRTIALRDLQRVLRPDEVCVDFALVDPMSYAVVVTARTARVVALPSRTTIAATLATLRQRVEHGQPWAADAQRAGTLLFAPITELATHTRLIVSPDAELHRVPVELLRVGAAASLLETHVVSYVPSGSVLAVLRTRAPSTPTGPLRVLAVSAPLTTAQPTAAPAPRAASADTDMDVSGLRALPGATEEARTVAALLGGDATVLIGEAATETAVKQQPLASFRVLHIAAHGVTSTRSPARSAVLLEPSATDDGWWQAREILMQRLDADLVTLSACDTGTGRDHGQDGVASIVHPFLAAGARSVVASLWRTDDVFSVALMKAFYAALARGSDTARCCSQTRCSSGGTLQP